MILIQCIIVHGVTIIVHDNNIIVHDDKIIVHDAKIIVHVATIIVHDAKKIVHDNKKIVHCATIIVHNNTIIVHDNKIIVDENKNRRTVHHLTLDTQGLAFKRGMILKQHTSTVSIIYNQRIFNQRCYRLQDGDAIDTITL